MHHHGSSSLRCELDLATITRFHPWNSRLIFLFVLRPAPALTKTAKFAEHSACDGRFPTPSRAGSAAAA
jgi:hypothetical protein